MGVLVAVSIPIFTSQLEKAREATGLANVRSAYAVLTSVALTTESDADLKKNDTEDIKYAVTGTTGTDYVVEATVSLKQMQSDWQTSGAANSVAGIKATGTPGAGGTAVITYTESTGTTTIVYSGT